MALYSQFLIAFAVLLFIAPRSVRSSTCLGIGGSVKSKRAESSDDSIHHRRLTAASPRSSLKARDISIRPRLYHVFHYVDHETHDTAAQVAAQVHITPKLPTLALEDVEALLDNVICTASTIELHFSQQELWNEALVELVALPRFMLVTSHIGCNEDGERRIYLVSGCHLSHDNLIARLSAEPMLWADTFKTMTVEFGSSQSTLDYDLRHHKALDKRQAASTVTLMPTIIYPFGPHSPTATAVLDSNIATQRIDQDLARLQVTQGNSSIPATSSESFSIGCKNCTVTGSVDITHGSLTLNGVPSTDDLTKDVIGFFHNGYLKIAANDLAAYIELDTTIDLKETIAYTGYLSGQPICLPAFQIPAIAKVGPYFDPQIHGTIVLDSHVTFTHGFEATVPNGSNMVLNFGNVANTTSLGFKATTITPIPFQASLPTFSLNATMGLKPAIGVGIELFGNAGSELFGNAGSELFGNAGSELFGNAGSATVDAFFDIPQIAVDVVPVTHANLNCEQPPPSSAANETLDYLFDNLLNVIPSVTSGIGAEYVAHIKETFSFCSATKSLKTWSLPTNCLAFDSKSSALVVAAVPSKSQGAAGLQSTDSTPSKLSHNPGAIAGICIGVVAAIALLGAGAFFLWRRQRRSHAIAPQAESQAGYETIRVEEQHDDGNESKADTDVETRSFIPSPLSSTFHDR